MSVCQYVYKFAGYNVSTEFYCVCVCMHGERELDVVVNVLGYPELCNSHLDLAITGMTLSKSL